MTYSKTGSKHTADKHLIIVFLRFFRFCRLTVRFLRLPKTGAKSDFQIENLISKPRVPRKNGKGHLEIENPVLCPALCPLKGQPNILNENRVIFGGILPFWSRGPAFRKPNALLDAPRSVFLHSFIYRQIDIGIERQP